MKKELTYQEKVFDFLDRQAECKIAIDKLCKPENREKFITVVKSYIDQGIVNGYSTEFSSDYLKIKKFDTILRTPADKLREAING